MSRFLLMAALVLVSTVNMRSALAGDLPRASTTELPAALVASGVQPHQILASDEAESVRGERIWYYSYASVRTTGYRGVLNLNVNYHDPYTGVAFVQAELNPETTAYSEQINIRIEDNPAKLYKRISNLVCDEQSEVDNLASKTWFDLEVDAQEIQFV